MPLELVTVPCLEDNYAFLVHNAETGDTALIDAPDAAPVQTALADRGWTLTDVLLTHHHWDHVDGLPALRGDARVVGASADAHRLPALDLAVVEGETFTVCGEEVQVFDVSGHTVGHIAFYLPGAGLAFTGDSLMAMGCGRLFEGTPAQMWASMQKLRALPPKTLICSGHEYTASNVAFALTLEPDNAQLISRADAIKAARSNGVFTVPSTLSDELTTNPYLRADDPGLTANVGMQGADPTAVFTEIRARKDRF
ncbi:hydroxyacylglutathione hydrolase [Yoonia sp. R2331]|uniref:hydroxyacylglutathione hydrolase n=1 Tax=Yoonia sp. R2331 TaxID=3237238 RepID=UPI0034E47C5B